MNATKRPWYSGNISLDCIVPNGTIYTAIPVHSESQIIVAILQRPGHDAEANARLIVTACNNFEKLQAMIELALKYLDHPDVKSIPFARPSASVAEQARALLAKVKGD